LQRLLIGAGHECVAVAPPLISIKAGDRVKTDRRDATILAKLHRAGELTAIWVLNRKRQRGRRFVLTSVR
jgi:transposase